MVPKNKSKVEEQKKVYTRKGIFFTCTAVKKTLEDELRKEEF